MLPSSIRSIWSPISEENSEKSLDDAFSYFSISSGYSRERLYSRSGSSCSFASIAQPLSTSPSLSSLSTDNELFQVSTMMSPNNGNGNDFNNNNASVANKNYFSCDSQSESSYSHGYERSSDGYESLSSLHDIFDLPRYPINITFDQTDSGNNTYNRGYGTSSSSAGKSMMDHFSDYFRMKTQQAAEAAAKGRLQSSPVNHS